MRIVVVSKIPIYPATGGNRARILTMVEALIARGIEVVFLLIPSRQMRDLDVAAHRKLLGQDNFQILALNAAEMFFYNLHLARRVAEGRIANRISRKRKSSSVDYLLPRFIAKKIAAAVDAGGYDGVIVQYVHFSSVLTHIKGRAAKIIDTHDSFQSEFTPAAEAQGLSRAHVVLAIQEREAQTFRNLLQSHRPETKTAVQVIGHLQSSDVPLVDAGSTAGVSFLGSDFYANRTSIAWFIDHVLPLILKQEPSFTLFVSGSIGNALEPRAGVKIHGVVPEIVDAFVEAPILVNPIIDGTGLKIKLVDALSHGVPVVSTAFGVDGVDPQLLEGVSITPDNSPESFAEKVLELYRSREMRLEMAAKARSSGAAWRARNQGAFATMIESIC